MSRSEIIRPGDTIAWDRLEAEVVAKLRVLRLSLRAFDGPGQGARNLARLHMRDLVAPNLMLLAKFCEAIQIQPDDEDDQAATNGTKETKI